MAHIEFLRQRLERSQVTSPLANNQKLSHPVPTLLLISQILDVLDPYRHNNRDPRHSRIPQQIHGSNFPLNMSEEQVDDIRCILPHALLGCCSFRQ